MSLSVGDNAPGFTVKDTGGNTVSLASYAGKTVVLYFYPKDDTPGCTKEACSFRDYYADYQGKDIVVFGVSMDDEASHKAFTDKFSLPMLMASSPRLTMCREKKMASITPSGLPMSLMGQAKLLRFTIR